MALLMRTFIALHPEIGECVVDLAQLQQNVPIHCAIRVHCVTANVDRGHSSKHVGLFTLVWVSLAG